MTTDTASNGYPPNTVPSSHGGFFFTSLPRPRGDPDPKYTAKLASCLRWDRKREEAYLELPSFPHIRMVPWREGVEDDLVEHFNEERVGIRLYILPYPSKAEEMVSEGIRNQATTGVTLALLRKRVQHSDDPEPGISNGSTREQEQEEDQIIFPPTEDESVRIEEGRDFLDWPFRCLWDEDRKKLIGCIGIFPHGYEHSPIKYTAEEVKALPRKEQEWDLSYNIRPEYRGKGIMSELVGVMLESWIKPYMRIGTFGAITEGDNPASQTVMLKNGLEYITSGQIWDWPVEKGGGTRETGRYARKLRV